MNDIQYEIVQNLNPIGEENCIIAYREVSTHDDDTNLHWHNALEIIFVIDGCIKYTVNGNINFASNGDIIIINSCDIHSTSNFTDQSTLKALLMVVPDSLIIGLAPSSKYSNFAIDHNHQSINELKESLDIISEMCKKSTSEYDNILIRSNLFRCIYLLLKYHCTSVNHIISKNDINIDIVNYVSEHYFEDISIKLIAEVAGFQPNYFCKYFKKNTGVTFHQYLCEIRLKIALSKLVSENLSILECALQSGFKSEKVLIEWCKRIHNCTPLQYKKRHKNTNLNI